MMRDCFGWALATEACVAVLHPVDQPKTMKKPARRSSVMAPSSTPVSGDYGDVTAAYGAPANGSSSSSSSSPKKSPKPMKKMARRPSQLPGAMSDGGGQQTLPLDLLEEEGDGANGTAKSQPVTPISEASGSSASGSSATGQIKLGATRGRQVKGGAAVATAICRRRALLLPCRLPPCCCCRAGCRLATVAVIPVEPAACLLHRCTPPPPPRAVHTARPNCAAPYPLWCCDRGVPCVPLSQASLSQHAMTASGEMDEMARALADLEEEEEGNELI